MLLSRGLQVRFLPGAPNNKGHLQVAFFVWQFGQQKRNYLFDKTHRVLDARQCASVIVETPS